MKKSLDELSENELAKESVISKTKKNVMDVVNNPNAIFGEGDQVCISLMPYFYGKIVMKS